MLCCDDRGSYVSVCCGDREWWNYDLRIVVVIVFPWNGFDTSGVILNFLNGNSGIGLIRRNDLSGCFLWHSLPEKMRSA
tara:strand:+ start:75801 stop:76037 length:237 start_codon:yes stop_codon:yes gene_type:complete